MIRNTVSGKVYIGQTTKTLGLRWTWHKSQASRSKTIFGCALLGYGSGAFMVLELGRAFSAEELNEMERRAIWSHSADDREFGYNMEPGGVGCGTVSIETRMKLSARGKGRPHSAQHRAKIGIANKGRKWSPESRAKISASLTGKKLPPFTEEHKAKISAALKGRKTTPPTDEQRAKISAAHKGKKFSADRLASHRGWKLPPRTEEHRAKIRAAWALRRTRTAEQIENKE